MDSEFEEQLILATLNTKIKGPTYDGNTSNTNLNRKDVVKVRKYKKNMWNNVNKLPHL